jgi:uncharacterized protein (DUF2384 family)
MPPARRASTPWLLRLVAMLTGLILLLLIMLVRGPGSGKPRVGGGGVSDGIRLDALPDRGKRGEDAGLIPAVVITPAAGDGTAGDAVPASTPTPAPTTKRAVHAIKDNGNTGGGAQVTDVEVVGTPRPHAPDGLPPPTVKANQKAVRGEETVRPVLRDKAGGGIASSSHRRPGEVPWRTFDDIHVAPLSGAMVRSAREAFVAGDASREPPFTGDLDFDSETTNRIIKLYRNVPPLPPGDAMHKAFKGPMWSSRPKLAPVLKRWVMLNRLVRSGKAPKQFQSRIVTVTPVGQLCNRLMAITSAFVFALTTGRALHIEDGGFYCAMSDLFKDPGFDWVGLGAASMSAETHRVQNPEGGVWDEMEPILCSDYADAYPEPTVAFSINQYLVPYFTTNPQYRQALLDLFGGDDIFTPAAHFLFRPIDMLLKMRDDYRKQHFQGKFVVGLQVRSGGDFTDNFMNEHDWSLYQRCGESMTPAALGPNLTYFIATDTARGREAAVKKFGADKVLFGPGEFLNSDHPRGVQMALLDLLLLAASDDRVTTAWSSYGYFAAGYSGVPAGIVVDQVDAGKLIAPKGEEQRFMGVPHKSDRRRQCVRLPVNQPCFHKFESWGASKATCSKWEWFEREMLNGRYC